MYNTNIVTKLDMKQVEFSRIFPIVRNMRFRPFLDVFLNGHFISLTLFICSPPYDIVSLRPGTDLSTNANEASRGRMSMKVLHVVELHKRSTLVCSFCLGLPRSRSCSSLYPA